MNTGHPYMDYAMSHTWSLLLIIIAMSFVCFFLMAPTYLANRFANRFELHPVLRKDSALSIRVNAEARVGEDKAQFISSFNQLNFLFRRYYDVNQSPPAHTISILQGRREIVLDAYLVENDRIVLVRHRGNKRISYVVEDKGNQFRHQLLRRAV